MQTTGTRTVWSKTDCSPRAGPERDAHWGGMAQREMYCSVSELCVCCFGQWRHGKTTEPLGGPKLHAQTFPLSTVTGQGRWLMWRNLRLRNTMLNPRWLLQDPGEEVKGIYKKKNEPTFIFRPASLHRGGV